MGNKAQASETGGCNKCKPVEEKTPGDGKKKQGGWRCCERVNNVTLAGQDIFKPVIGSVDLVIPPTHVVSVRSHVSVEDKLHYTGPPGAISFAELVLQRSLLAHAPPFSV